MWRFKTKHDAKTHSWVAIGYCEWHEHRLNPQTYFYIV